MDLVTDRSNGILVAEAWARVDGSNAHDFEQALKGASSADDSAMIIDFGGLTYISSAGLRVILLTAKTLEKENTKFAICSLADRIREVFEISGFDKIIQIHKTREEALAAVSG